MSIYLLLFPKSLYLKVIEVKDNNGIWTTY